MTRFYVVKVNEPPSAAKYETMRRCATLEEAKNEFGNIHEKQPELHLLLNQIAITDKALCRTLMEAFEGKLIK